MKLFKKEKKIALLEIGKTYLKIAILEEDFKKNKIVTKLLKLDLDNKETGIEVFNQQNLSFDDLIIIVSRDWVTIRNLELPTTDPQEIKDIIALQARKQTPLSAEEIVADFQTIGSVHPHYTKVLLAIVQKSVINSYLNNFVSLRIPLPKIALDSECLINWYPILKHKVKAEIFAILDFDFGFCDFCVLSKERLLFTRLLPFSALDLLEKTWKKNFLEEVKISLDIYRKDNLGPTFNKVIFMGRDKFAMDLKDILARELYLEAVDFFESIEENLTLSSDAKTVLEREKKEGISFSKIMGLALNPDRPSINFLPRDLKEVRQKEIQRKETILSAVLIFSVLIMSMIIFLEKIYTKVLFLKRLDNQFTKLESQTTGLKEENSKISLIKSRINAKNSAIEVLCQIHKVTPQEIYLSNIDFEENKLVSLRGTSASMSSVPKFVKTLKEMAMFKDVKTKYVTERVFKDRDLTDFEITCSLASEGIK